MPAWDTRADALANLVDALPTKPPVTLERVGIYLAELADIPPGTLREACQRLIRTSRFFPTVAEIREVAAEIALALPTEAEALAQIHARQGWVADAATAPPPEGHPLVKAAIDQVGGWFVFRASENQAVVRGQFGRIYREQRAAAVAAAQAGDWASARGSLPA